MRGNERDSEKLFQYESLRDKVKLLRQTMKTKESSEYKLSTSPIEGQ